MSEEFSETGSGKSNELGKSMFLSEYAKDVCFSGTVIDPKGDGADASDV